MSLKAPSITDDWVCRPVMEMNIPYRLEWRTCNGHQVQWLSDWSQHASFSLEVYNPFEQNLTLNFSTKIQEVEPPPRRLQSNLWGLTANVSQLQMLATPKCNRNKNAFSRVVEEPFSNVLYKYLGPLKAKSIWKVENSWEPLAQWCN